jgi:OOP family OmpA-OmpF porin
MKRLFLAVSLAGLAGTASAQPGYVVNSTTDNVVTNPFGLCWHSGDWSADKAAPPCDGGRVVGVVVPAPEPTPPVVVAAPAPAPIVAAPPPVVIEKVTLSSDVLFDFNKATLKEDGKRELDELAQRLKDAKVDTIEAVGHADRIASEKYNQKLSEQRAQAVSEYLASTGIASDKIRAEGKGKSEPITGDQCRKMGPEKGSNRRLVECLQPDRRVDIQVLGSREVAAGSSPSGAGASTGGSATGR